MLWSIGAGIFLISQPLKLLVKYSSGIVTLVFPTPSKLVNCCRFDILFVQYKYIRALRPVYSIPSWIVWIEIVFTVLTDHLRGKEALYPTHFS